MHVLLTDILTCPRCGPSFGLVLLARETRDRRVLEGFLGCANCRDRWTIAGGFGEFRAPIGAPLPEPETEARSAPSSPARVAGDGEAVRIAALLGVTEGPAQVLLTGPATRHAAAVAGLVEHLEVIAADPALEHGDERPGVSRVAVGAVLPFANARLQGIWLGGEAADTHLEEAARALWPLGRLVLEPAPADTDARLASTGLRVLARSGETVVAARTT